MLLDCAHLVDALSLLDAAHIILCGDHAVRISGLCEQLLAREVVLVGVHLLEGWQGHLLVELSLEARGGHATRLLLSKEATCLEPGMRLVLGIPLSALRQRHLLDVLSTSRWLWAL